MLLELDRRIIHDFPILETDIKCKQNFWLFGQFVVTGGNNDNEGDMSMGLFVITESNNGN